MGHAQIGPRALVQEVRIQTFGPQQRDLTFQPGSVRTDLFQVALQRFNLYGEHRPCPESLIAVHSIHDEIGEQETTQDRQDKQPKLERFMSCDETKTFHKDERITE